MPFAYIEAQIWVEPTAACMKKVLAAIVLAQACCTSVWFASNAVVSNLVQSLKLQNSFLAHITSAVQAGFIVGTLVYAVLAIADRFSPSKVFFVSAVLASVFNLAMLTNTGVAGLILFRFLTGFFLAGIYPVGMKIASDYYGKGLGASLGFLVGALVLGTALPHALKSMGADLPWNYVVWTTSGLALLGGALIYTAVPDGPFRTKGQHLQLTTFAQGFKKGPFRAAAFGYFGHMWELYAFWAFVPLMLTYYNQQFPHAGLSVSLTAFFIIAAGGVACVVSGLLSKKIQPKKLATTFLFLSFLCCSISPFFLQNASPTLLVVFLLFWGWVVVADSPMFSTLVAQQAPPESRGTALTIVNCIGFLITIVSIQAVQFLLTPYNATYVFILLAVGPLLGLWALVKKAHKPLWE